MAIEQNVLRRKSSNYYKTKLVTETFSSAGRKAFLCHSHKDKELVEGLVVLLEDEGVDLYVDWKDGTMPAVTNAETAKKIQDRIKRSDLFLFLATEDSMKSRWCPWEIGYGDACNKDVFIIPTSVGYTEYGSEYLGLYSKIDKGVYNVSQKPGYFVWKAGENVGGELKRTL